MKKRFIVAIQGMTAEQEQAFADFLDSKSCGWWHWIYNFWLVVDPSETLTAASLRDEINTISPGLKRLVVDVTESRRAVWAGYGPSSEERNMFNWLREDWDSE